MQGHVESRNKLACFEIEKWNHACALRHIMIAAKMGDENSIVAIKTIFMDGCVTKELYAEALKGTKKPWRK